MDRLDRWALALVTATYGLLVVGASVRVNGAGLACPDWPLCFGEILPPMNVGVGFEFGHRVLAGVVSIGFLALVAALARAKQRTALRIAGLAGVALIVQIVLGGLTVLHLLAEWTVASHLVVGNTFCLLLLVMALELGDRAVPVERAPVTWAQRGLAVTLAAIVPVQLVLGGFVSSSNAGLVCGTWPTCDGVSFAPVWTGLVGLQVVHRLVAYALCAVALLGAVVARGRGRRAAIAAALAVLAQATIGVANVLLQLPVEVTLLHTAGAAAVVLTTTWTNWEAWRAPISAGTASVNVVGLAGR